MWILFTVRNEVAKVMFLQARVCPRGGGLLPGGVCSRGMSAPGCVCSEGGVCSRGVSAPGRSALLQGGLLCPPPRERQLLLRTVRILLECILVVNVVNQLVTTFLAISLNGKFQMFKNYYQICKESASL